MRPIIVFDTNILFSGIGWRGKPYRCLEMARAAKIEGVTCLEVLDELVNALQNKLLYSDAEIVNSIADLLTFMRVVPIPGTLKVISADPDDDKILECATVAGAA